MFHLARRRLAALVALLVLVAVLVACSSAGGSPTLLSAQRAADTFAQGGTGEAVKPDPAAAAPASPPDAALADAERKIVKTGEISIEVPNVAAALGRVRATALQMGGYVGASQAGTLDQSATLTLRVPAARFDDTLAALHELDGKVTVEATREEDVTSTVVDLTARISNLEASEAQYRALLSRAQKIEDILSVQSRLDQVRGEIEQLKGQLKSVSSQADLATLTVTLTPRPQPVQQASSTWDPGAIASQAVAAVLEIAQAVASGAIWLAIVGLPILVVLFLILAALLRLGVFRRPVRSAEPPVAS